MQVQSVFKCNYVSIILQSGFTRYQLVFKGFTLTLSMPIGELSLFGSEIKLASPINNPWPQIIPTWGEKRGFHFDKRAVYFHTC